MLHTSLFYIFSALTVVFALGVVLARSAVYSTLCLVGAMCAMAGLFVLLKAYLVATILVLVYAGAILVLFLFVVMLVDFRDAPAERFVPGLSPVKAALIAGLLIAQTLWVVRSIGHSGKVSIEGTVRGLGEVLFHKYVLPFELTAFLILAAVISVVVLAKKEKARS
ncbi:MAG: NADH-quinone oxidoreductase subunit J [Candidatus Omnitrophica bacterium]|nr:NADH-quinone oxidoreductase subunit J [Candidatus Omnitrophota bacterium]